MAREKADSWGKTAEIKFIKGLGTYQQTYATDYSERRWLQMYIQAHKRSPHPHHKAGVVFALRQLER